MNLVYGVARITTNTSAQISPTNQPLRIQSIHLVSIPTASTLTFRNGSLVTDDAYLQVDGAASQGVTLNFAGGMYFPDGCYISTDISLSWVTISYTTEF